MARVQAWLKERARRIVLLLAFLTLLPPLSLIVAAALTPLPEELRSPPPSESIRVLDRDGHLLREVRADDGARARWVPLAEVGPKMVAAMVAAEDRRFYQHHGVDPLAVLRAAGSNVRHLRVVSGASTLTMQLARTVRPRPRTVMGKLREMALALRIEASLSKEQILEQYLNRVAFGANLRGVFAASQAWFDKPPSRLSTAECALLAGLVHGPSLYAPDRSPERARARRSVVLARMLETGAIDANERARAEGEPVVPAKVHPSFGAPHFVSALVSGAARSYQPGLDAAWGAGPGVVETTLDGALQREAEATVRVVLDRLEAKHVTAASVVVIDNATGDVLAWVGSPDVFDRARLGANDGVLARRQPGSALKPFLYELAMETRDFTPATVLPDVELQLPVAAGVWSPQNFDGRHHGPVRLRDALGSSLNVPAAWTATKIGVAPFLDRLRSLGLSTLTEEAAYYGPALALGDGEVRLLELANAYATLARGGVAKPLRLVRALSARGGERKAFEPGKEARLLPTVPVSLITDVLRDRNARLQAFGDHTALDFDFDVAAKTGTSKNFRDNWAIGFSTAVTVGVWVGNFDGSPMQQVSGITGAGPIFHAVMEASMRARTPGSLAAVEGDELVSVELCALSGHRATPLCKERVRELLPTKIAHDLPFDTSHVLVRIDRRNGLRAGPGCSAAETELRVYERYAPELVAWAMDAGRPLVPAESSPFCPAEDLVDDFAVDLAIKKPIDGAKLVVDPDRPRSLQLLEIAVVAPSSTTEVTLKVDGASFATSKRPFLFEWPLSPGDHVFVAEAQGRASAAVRVHVRE